MFDDIEREYKKGLQEKRFVAYYWPRALIIVLAAITLSFIIGVNRWIVYVCAAVIFVGLVAIFFIKEYYHAHQTMSSVRQSKSFSTKISAYFRVDDSRRIEKLLADLARHGLYTKSDLKLTLDYFQSRLPINQKPNLLEWIFTAVITLSSIVIVTYDSSISNINLHRLFTIIVPTVIVALIILTPFIIVKFISTALSKSHNKVDTSLVQDLAYIYVNYDKFRSRLEVKSTAPDSNEP